MLRARVGALAAGLLILAGCISPSTEVRRERNNPAPSSSSRHDGQRPRPAASAAGHYVVQPGDTLFRIAFRHQVSVDDLVHWNGIANPDRIQVGQRLRIGSDLPAAPLPEPTGTLASSAGAAEPVTTAPDRTDPQTGVVTSAVPTSAVAEVAPTPEPLTFSEPEPVGRPAAAGAPVATRPATPPPTPSLPTPSSPPTSSAASAPVLSTANLPPDEATMPAPSTAQVVPTPGIPVSSAPLGSGAAPTATRGGWSWPLSGRLVGTFVAGDVTRSGLDISGSEGQAIYAAADGEVVYSGTGILGYGELIVIQHPSGLLSAYGHNRKRLVTEGAKLKRGQQIAEMGRDPSGRQLLHFEIRKNGKPVDPLAYLPGR